MKTTKIMVKQHSEGWAVWHVEYRRSTHYRRMLMLFPADQHDEAEQFAAQQASEVIA